jgi:hypothetical protein
VQAPTAALTTIIRPFGDLARLTRGAGDRVHFPLRPENSCHEILSGCAKTATLGFIAEYLARSCVNVRAKRLTLVAPTRDEVHFRREV